MLNKILNFGLVLVGIYMATWAGLAYSGVIEHADVLPKAWCAILMPLALNLAFNRLNAISAN